MLVLGVMNVCVFYVQTLVICDIQYHFYNIKQNIKTQHSIHGKLENKKQQTYSMHGTNTYSISYSKITMHRQTLLSTTTTMKF